EKNGYFDSKTSEELIEAFSFLLTLRLESGLKRFDGKNENMIEPKSLSKFQRDLLRDTLKLVSKLKDNVSHHFKLSIL
ncbi:MAG: hypothetical protein GXZ15_03000, partial [Campylobacter sp.]|nr:hypothetical protein [Campylobacter sp.]